MTNKDYEVPNFNPGDVVTVKDYCGAARVVNVEQDGVTPQGYPKWLYTVEFGAFSGSDNGPASATGYALKNAPMSKYYGVGRTLKKAQGRYHEFYQGKLSPFYEDDDDSVLTVEQEVRMMSREEIIEKLKEMGIPVP
jgi:hypothetical protein